MKKPTFRALAWPGILLMCLSITALTSGQSVTTTKSVRPGVVVRPATPAAVKGPSIVITPAKPPVVVKPVKPIVVTPVVPTYPVSPGFVYPVHPGYPSAWVGPTIVRETRSELLPPDSGTYPPPPPGTIPSPSMTVQGPTVRLVVLLGSLRRLDPASGAEVGMAEAPVGISVGALAGYTQDKPTRASGDFFGVSWDGRDYFTKSGDASQGPYLDHPMLTLNELSPGPWEFEAGMTGRRVAWVRLALTLFEDGVQDPFAKQVNLPRGRRAAMREVLHRIAWNEKPVAARTSGTSDEAALTGGDVTHFGKALATFAEQTMAPTQNNERVGIAEWFISAQELAKMLPACPQFINNTPDAAQLREARAGAGKTVPPWVRTCELHNDSARYAAELWFVIVPDTAVGRWLQNK
jgi:hypothetical protein